MRVVQAPEEYHGTDPSLFLAGGISDCEPWQERMIELLSEWDLVILNPRQQHFEMDNLLAAERQIEWEFRHLRRAAAKLFWFPPQTLCPIALYELGTWTAKGGPLFIGLHPDYARRDDVIIQTRLARPEIRIVHSLPELAEQVQAAALNGSLT